MNHRIAADVASDVAADVVVVAVVVVVLLVPRPPSGGVLLVRAWSVFCAPQGHCGW